VSTRVEVTDVAAPRAGISRGRGRLRGRGRGGAHVSARALVGAIVEETRVAPIGGQVPEAHMVTPRLHETLTQLLGMFGTLTQPGLIPVALPTSHIGGGDRTFAALTPKQRTSIGQVPGVIPT